jgi:hypothetical protein
VTRDSYETVTGKREFVLLVSGLPHQEAMGEATFGPELGSLPVAPVRIGDLKATARRLRGTDGKEFSALLALRDALEACDKLAQARAQERLERIFRERARERATSLPEDNEQRRKTGELWRVTGLSPMESVLHIEGLRAGPKAIENPNRLLGWAVSGAVGMWAQPVLWSVNGTLHPAIFCNGPNPYVAMRTALYVHTFFIAPVGGLGFRSCPYDGQQFFQERPNQEYCCPAHREAHRVTRWRDRKRSQQKRHRKGGADGTDKTR